MTAEFLLAFSAGTLSFFAPCALPLVPAYVAYLGGASLPDIQRDPTLFQRRIAGGGILYVVGFGLVFITLGLAAGWLGAGLAHRHAALVQRAGGVIVVAMGFAMLGWLPARLGVRRFQPFAPAAGGTSRRPGWLAPLILGVVFGTAWTPCVGPVLAAILVLAAQHQEILVGGLLLTAYTLGLGLPFVVASLLVASFPAILMPWARFSGRVNQAAGASLLVLGTLLLAGVYPSLAGYLGQPFVGR